ncbi:hypothetical protein F8M41_003555 [Gigaspora margarita]|uniref:Uncharacterized protein n=1 Tax=Gigaspora margarita TaxID=4874 RepID=A0A8H4ES89_GIGMA|nr:hypothetical protein F8M41_003555 [Gigaspora margarita]
MLYFNGNRRIRTMIKRTRMYREISQRQKKTDPLFENILNTVQHLNSSKDKVLKNLQASVPPTSHKAN